MTAAAGELDREAYRGLGVVFGDYDDDCWPDLLVANDAQPNLLFHNEGNGTFTEVAFDAGVAFDEDGRERAGMGVDLGDYDNDGRLDAVITNFQGEPNSLYRNLGQGTFLETTWAVRPRRSRRCPTSAGARASPTSTTTAGATSSSSTATSTRRSTATASRRRSRSARSSSATGATAASRT